MGTPRHISDTEMTRRRIGVVVIVATRLYREGLTRILGRHPRVEVLGSSAELDDGVERATASSADVVLLDTAAAPRPQALRHAVDALPRARLVAFGIAESEEVVIRCAEAGVSGYVPHDATVEELVMVLEGAIRDELICSPRLAATLLRRVGVLARERSQIEVDEPVRLTSRETQIVALIDEGLSNKQIASRLQIELPTVKNHVHRILEKVGVSRRGEAAARIRSLRRSFAVPLSTAGTGSRAAN